MALKPRSEKPGAGAPPGYLQRHAERPEHWGWHGRWGRGARIAGWIVAAILALMTTTTNYQSEYVITLLVLAGLMVAGMVGYRLARRNRWRR